MKHIALSLSHIYRRQKLNNNENEVLYPFSTVVSGAIL